MTDGPAAPYVAVVGPPHTANVFYLVIENEPVVVLTKCFDALAALFVSFYVFWLSYPKECSCTFKFIQIILFGRSGAEDGNVPGKLMTVLKKLE